MAKIHIYFEGGGAGGSLRSECRRAFGKFFERAGFAGRMPKVIPSGSRSKAYSDFCRAVLHPEPGVLPMLLVDSEAPVAGTPWSHVGQQQNDQWTCPQAATDDHLHLMVQCMESWFLADVEVLQQYFGNGFNQGALPATKNVETIAKSTVLNGLHSATRQSDKKGAYRKGRDSFELLERLNPQKVAAASMQARRLLSVLTSQ
ncbi:MAG: DUF4276 family protein [Planctomycetaceae bacterium]|nr:DUF4276 family protein [Planctomycetaceae bacterium]